MPNTRQVARADPRCTTVGAAGSPVGGLRWSAPAGPEVHARGASAASDPCPTRQSDAWGIRRAADGTRRTVSRGAR